LIELEQRCEEACVARVSPLAYGRRHLMVTKSFLPRILIISSCRAPTNFCRNLLARFGTSEGAIRTYLGCALERDILAGTTTLFQKNYAEDVCAHMAPFPSLLFFHHTTACQTTVATHLDTENTYLVCADTWNHRSV